MPSGLAQAVVCERTPWRNLSVPGLTAWTAGDDAAGRAIVNACASSFSLDSVADTARTQPGLFAAIVESASGILAVGDHCRSFPIFYTDRGARVVGNNARAVRDAAGLSAFDAASICEAAMAGFVTGPHTLVQGLNQLNCGEVIFLPKSGPDIAAQRTCVYVPQPQNDATDGEFAARLDATIDAAVDRVIAQASGAPIWVPLSGGLDSRLVLSKLQARGCINLYSFSYGPRSNADAMVARAVAKRLGVPWRFVAISGAEMRGFFAGQIRRDYWDFADGLASVPNNQDLLPLIRLRQAGALSEDAVIVNGQTGDFISGGHIPVALFERPQTVGTLLDAIVRRHYTLWRSLLTADNVATITSRIRATLALTSPDDAPLTAERAIALWERFEYEGRQAKYIVNGQRIYDFLGLHWALPLWDGGVVAFWRDVPTALKRDQRLYRDTWLAWDHRGVFSMPTRPISAWSRPLAALLVPLSIMGRLAFGRTRRDRTMTYARYFDRFGNHYQAFGWRQFARHAADTRNPVSYYTRAWLDSLGADWPGERTLP